MLETDLLLSSDQTDDKPPGIALMVTAASVDADRLRTMFREVWTVVSRWGRWSDEQLGEWDDQRLVRQLPNWFLTIVELDPRLATWMDDVHDRQYVVWRVLSFGHTLKIAVSSDAYPVGYFPVVFVLQALGVTNAITGAWRAGG